MQAFPNPPPRPNQPIMAGNLLGLLLLLVVQSSTQDFALQLADMSLTYSYAAYCSEPALRSWSCFWCNDTTGAAFEVHNVMHDQQTNTFGYVGTNHSAKTHVVALRGTVTSSIKNWLLDADFALVAPFGSAPDAHVHEGILRTYLTLRPGIADSVRELSAALPDYDWLVTGHSLGAAAATLCAFDLFVNSSLLKSRPQLYTFGSPRVGNSGFSQAFNQSMGQGAHWRLVHAADPIPHLPPVNFIGGGWHHTSREVWNEHYDTNTTLCNDSGEDPRCSDSVSVGTECRY